MATLVLTMPGKTLFANPNPAVPSARSLMSRFSSPLAKHARNMFDLTIEPEDPFKVYSPGEVVKGHLVLKVHKGFEITHLVVALHGYAKVYKHQIAPGEGLPSAEALANGKGSRGFEYYGNGLASLFQEEQVLCGQGFLKKSVYKFAFELRFPMKSMPSTIEFERGTVSYMISTTLTRPTAISPTTTRYQRIKFQDSIDIESMYTPKTRVISLEPVSRRGKVKKVRQATSNGTQDTSSARSQLSRKNTQNSTFSTTVASMVNPPLSPAPSDDTIATVTTTSTQSYQAVDNDFPTRKPSPQTSDAISSTTSSSSHTITATTELPRHGALPGDTIPVRVTVTHTKPFVKGVVIATLFRQGRVDMHPDIPLATKNRDKKDEYEDVYPRSRTGLGGLYFANASPSSVFRKDLAQSSTMMIINPNTLTADITTSVKVPDTAFPTISNVPGGMISFTYHVEVVIDLFGKLGETRLLPRLTSSDPTFTSNYDNGNQLTSDWSSNILDTTQLRRTKSVVAFEMSLVIGTKDSGRNRRQQRFQDLQNGDQYQYDYQEWSEDGYNQGGHDDYYYYDEAGYPHYYDGYEGYDYAYQDYHHDQDGPLPDMIPLPEPEEQVDEKTRLRRQEQLLLPSQPPQEGESSAAAAVLAPSAPVLNHDNEGLGESIAAPPTPGPAASVASARSADTIRPYSASPPPAIPGGDVPAADDKLGLERLRLLEQASAPPTDDREASSSNPPPPLAASAPLISEDEYNTHTLHHDHGELDLPQYER